MSVRSRQITPSVGSYVLNHFRTGPLVIFPSDTTVARTVITAFNNKISGTTNDIKVYQTNQTVNADVRYTLVHKPFLAIYNDGGKASIHRDVYNRAMIDTSRYRTLAPNYVIDSSSCFTFASTPHWDVKSGYSNSDSTRLLNLKSFVLSGGNFLAQCEGIDAVENFGLQRYLTTNGVQTINTGVSTQQYANWDMPISQFQGAFTQDGGSIYNYRPGTTSEWTSTYYPGAFFMKNVIGSAALDTVVQFSACKFAGENGVGGNMIYLGGHSYDGTSLANVNGMRVHLNSILIPAKRLINEGLISPNHTYCQGDTIKIEFTPPSTGYTYQWTGPNGYNSTIEDPVILNATSVKAGTYSAIIFAGEGCKYNYSTTVTVNPKPEFSATTTQSTICEGDACTISFSPSANMTNTRWYKKNMSLPGCLPTGPVLYTSTSQVVYPDSTTTFVVISENQYGCKDTSCVTITVDIMPKLTSPFATATPLCHGRGVVATITAGFGGTGCTETYQWKMDNGPWQPYTSGTTVGQGAQDSVRIRVTRSCAEGCVSRSVSSKWTVTPPQVVGAGSTLYNCTDAAGYIATLTATNPAPSTGVWQIASGPGTIASPSSISTTAGGLSRTGASTNFRWIVTNAINCKDTAYLTITPPVVDTSMVSIYDNEYCITCPIQNGNTYSYYDANGKLLAVVTDNPGGGAIGPTTLCAQLPYDVSGDPQVSDVESVPTWIQMHGFVDQPYLPRAWNVNTTNDAPMTINLYFTDEEVAALLGATLNEGGYFYFDNVPELLVAVYPSNGDVFVPAGSPGGSVIVPTFTRVGDYWEISFEVDRSSTFYVYPTYWQNSPLPVELIEFTASPKDDYIQLDWATASEVNNLRFDVERSIDAINFNKIGEVAGAGSTRGTNKYRFDDENVVSGTMYYYRLKQVDFDGQFNYSKIVQAVLNGSGKLTIGALIPNPAENFTSVVVKTGEAMPVSVSVFTVDGTRVKDLRYDVDAGAYSLTIETDDLAKGTYLLRIQTKFGTETRKLVKLQ